MVASMLIHKELYIYILYIKQRQPIHIHRERYISAETISYPIPSPLPSLYLDISLYYPVPFPRFPVVFSCLFVLPFLFSFPHSFTRFPWLFRFPPLFLSFSHFLFSLLLFYRALSLVFFVPLSSFIVTFPCFSYVFLQFSVFQFFPRFSRFPLSFCAISRFPRIFPWPFFVSDPVFPFSFLVSLRFFLHFRILPPFPIHASFFQQKNVLILFPLVLPLLFLFFPLFFFLFLLLFQPFNTFPS